MKKAIFIILILAATAAAQERFDIKKASKLYDIRLEVEKCDKDGCSGDAKFSIYRKGAKTPIQVVRTPTEFMAEEAKMPNAKLMYDYQSVVFFEDYNFDGIEDLAIRDGNNGGYGGPSYQIYLYSAKTKKFVQSEGLTDLNQGNGLGMMEVDKKKKVLRVFSKSGCCFHETDEYKVIGGRPKLVYKWTEDATIADEKRVRVTTKTLVNGRWRSVVRYLKREN